MESGQILRQAIEQVLSKMNLSISPKLVIEEPRDSSFGDLATNVALVSAKEAKKNPGELARAIAKALPEADTRIQSATVAGPGFINVIFTPQTWQQVIPAIEKEKDKFGCSNAGRGKRALVEYVSANPTGPLHVGHGRGAALGDTIARILKAAGYEVDTEYYLNDAGKQMRTLGYSIWLRLQGLVGPAPEFPDDAYQGSYIIDLARELHNEKPDVAGMPKDQAIAICQQYGTEKILETIKADLNEFRSSHDQFTSEAALVESGKVSATLDQLAKAGHSYIQDGALWLKTSAHGDDRDRVLRKSDGYLTYFATDIAYHNDKLKRGYNWLIDVWGADHHGYIPRMKAALTDTGNDPEALSVLLVQLVNLQRDGQAVSMSTRSGEFVTLAEVIKEVGTDAARFSFLSRSSDSPLDFDLELVKKRTLENPVYYVQYAYARICALMRRSQQHGITLPDMSDEKILGHLQAPEELAILRQLAMFTDVITSAASNLAPQQITRYLQELAGKLHAYYAKYKILDDSNQEYTLARLALLRSAGQILHNALNLLGVSAPESM